eukprot:1160885-Pelagomonas_calceolata.AAC.11
MATPGCSHALGLHFPCGCATLCPHEWTGKHSKCKPARGPALHTVSPPAAIPGALQGISRHSKCKPARGPTLCTGPPLQAFQSIQVHPTALNAFRDFPSVSHQAALLCALDFHRQRLK